MRCALARIELCANVGMDAVAGNEDRAFGGRQIALLVAEGDDHAAIDILAVDRLAARHHRALAGAGFQRMEQHHLETAAMDGELRPGIARELPARLRPDLLALLGEIGDLAGAHADRVHLRLEPHLEQFAHGMRLHIDADAQRLQLAHLLEDAKRNARLMARNGKRQAGNAGPGDDDGHEPSRVAPFTSSW